MLSEALTASEYVPQIASAAMPPTMTMARARGSGQTSVDATASISATQAAVSQARGTLRRSNWRSAATLVVRPTSIAQLPKSAGTHTGTWPCSMCAAAATPRQRLEAAHNRSPGIGWRSRRSSASSTMQNTTHSAATTASSDRPSIVIAASPSAILRAWAWGTTSWRKF